MLSSGSFETICDSEVMSDWASWTRQVGLAEVVERTGPNQSHPHMCGCLYLGKGLVCVCQWVCGGLKYPRVRLAQLRVRG